MADRPMKPSLPEPRQRQSPEWLLVRSFLSAILIGAILLTLPISHRDNEWFGPLDALFTATSATCVTGLVVVDTYETFSLFGQLVILALIQVGAVGIITLATFLLFMIGVRIRMKDQSAVMDSLGFGGVKGLKGLLIVTLLYTCLFEAIGAAILTYANIRHHDFEFSRALYHGVFHAVSAFGNAGFALYSNNLADFSGDPLYLMTICALIVLGGIGFVVLFNISTVRFWSRDLLSRGRLTLHSRCVIVATLILIIAGWLLFLVMERRNTCDNMGLGQQSIVALVHSVSPRTAGFNVVSMADLTPLAFFGTIILMLIGGSPASTAGGLKTTTVLVLMLTVFAMVRGKTRTQIYHRTIPDDVVREAIVIATLGLTLIVVAFCALLVTEQFTFPLRFVSNADALLFEVVSAFGTVGLSTGITPLLTPIGKLIVIALMFLGRVGPVTLSLLVARRQAGESLHYPEEDVIVG